VKLCLSNHNNELWKFLAMVMKKQQANDNNGLVDVRTLFLEHDQLEKL
jgi:hypothetical protein